MHPVVKRSIPRWTELLIGTYCAVLFGYWLTVDHLVAFPWIPPLFTALMLLSGLAFGLGLAWSGHRFFALGLWVFLWQVQNWNFRSLQLGFGFLGFYLLFIGLCSHSSNLRSRYVWLPILVIGSAYCSFSILGLYFMIAEYSTSEIRSILFSRHWAEELFSKHAELRDILIIGGYVCFLSFLPTALSRSRFRWWSWWLVFLSLFAALFVFWNFWMISSILVIHLALWQALAFAGEGVSHGN